jgi:hypothetical protein
MVDQDSMEMGIKGSNNEPRTQIRWREKSVRSGIVPHDKHGSDINGTIDDIATKRTTPPSRIMPGSVVLDPDIAIPRCTCVCTDCAEVHR